MGHLIKVIFWTTFAVCTALCCTGCPFAFLVQALNLVVGIQKDGSHMFLQLANLFWVIFDSEVNSS